MSNTVGHIFGVSKSDIAGCRVLLVMELLSYFFEFIAINRAEFIVYRDKSKTREISLSNLNVPLRVWKKGIPIEFCDIFLRYNDIPNFFFPGHNWSLSPQIGKIC